jgi:UDP-N-acetylglucosamine 2-epimerase (non-hydrolysing)
MTAKSKKSDIVTIVGARPQFIKASILSRSLQQSFDEIIVHTGQHYDSKLSNIFFTELNIPTPRYNLDVGSGTHGEQSGPVIADIEQILLKHDPQFVLLYGDTNSTLAGAIAGSKLSPLVCHVEAGVRSFNRSMPEEINRIVTDHVADIHFAPSETAVHNLASEGVTDHVYNVGDVMLDSLTWAREHMDYPNEIIADLGLAADEYILCTVHRAVNTDSSVRLSAIVGGLAEASLPVVFPAHPRTVNSLRDHGLWKRVKSNVHLIDPVGYFDFINLIDGATLVTTDSGGVQKEAFFLNTPCVTLRDETEWPETVTSGWNELVGADQEAIVSAIQSSADPGDRPQPYGDGTASERCVRILNEITSVD